LAYRDIGEPEPPISALALADWLRIPVQRTHRRALARFDAAEGLIYLGGASLRGGPRLHEALAHELGHAILHRYEAEQDEASASLVGLALMLPRGPFLRDVAELGRDLRALGARHVHCSPRMLETRLAWFDEQAGERFYRFRRFG